MKKFINALVIITAFIFTSCAQSTLVIPKEDQSLEATSDLKKISLLGTPVICDEKIIDAYESVWFLATESKELSNATVAKISSLNKLHECGCVTNRLIKTLSVEDEDDEDDIAQYKTLFTKKSRLSTVGAFFERFTIDTIQRSFPSKSTHLCYVSVGSGDLLLDLRLLIALQKAGYQDLTIVLIDNDSTPIAQLTHGEDNQSLYTQFCKKYKHQKKITRPENSIEQFCAILSASGMKTTIIVYNSLKAYYSDCLTDKSLMPNIVLEVDTPRKKFAHSKFGEDVLYIALHKGSVFSQADFYINGVPILIETYPSPE
jgi:hypothetical protein